jgi:hypothetical protein
MSTLNITTTALATTNRTRINLYKESAPTAVIDSITHDAPHGQETWSFFNLVPDENYRYRYLEIDGSGNTIQQYATQIFTVPPSASTVEIKPTAYLIAGSTPGMATGTHVAVFDGTNGTQDYRGWDITVDKPGFGDQFPTENYTWDKVTGTFTVLTGDWLDGEKYTFQFDPKVSNIQQVISKQLYSGVIIVDNNKTLTASDIKNKIIIEGVAPYLEITLPDITLIPENEIIYFESGIGLHKCAAIKSGNANTIKWLEGNKSSIFIKPNETIQLYRYGSTIRVHHSDGNFKTVGQIVSEDAPQANIFNKQELDGSELDIQEDARLYEYVSKLPSNQVVSYDDWLTNKTKYSLANPANKFHVPDRRRLFERQIDAGGIPGTPQDSQNLLHDHDLPIWADDAANAFKTKNIPVRRLEDFTVAVTKGVIHVTQTSGGDEARPINYSIRRYVLL